MSLNLSDLKVQQRFLKIRVIISDFEKRLFVLLLLNPADIGPRCISVFQFAPSELWFNCPNILYLDKFWPELHVGGNFTVYKVNHKSKNNHMSTTESFTNIWI